MKREGSHRTSPSAPVARIARLQIVHLASDFAGAWHEIAVVHPGPIPLWAGLGQVCELDSPTPKHALRALRGQVLASPGDECMTSAR